MSASRDERMQVLEMVASGQITPDEGNQLLEALGASVSVSRDAEPGLVRAGARGEARQFERPAKRQRGRSSHAGFEKLTEARMHGVTPSFVQEMRDAGFADLSLDQLIELRMHAVNREFVREMREAGFVHPRVEELVELRMHGVDTDFIREMAEAGLPELTLEELVEARMHGVNGAFIRDMQVMGFVDPTLDRAIELRGQRVEGEAEGELGDTSSDQMDRGQS